MNRDDVWVEVDAITNSIASIVETNVGTSGAFESLSFDGSTVNTVVLDDVDPVTVKIFSVDGERNPGEPAFFAICIDQPLDSPLLVSLSTGDTITIPTVSMEFLYTVNDTGSGDITVSIVSAGVTSKTFESLVVSPGSAMVTDPPIDGDDHFPTLDKDISHITIYFSAAEGSDLESLDL